MVQARYVPRRCGDPIGLFNRPSVEYTGRGNELCCLAWNGRYFRSSEADVRKACDKVVKACNGNEEEDGCPVSIGDLEAELGILVDDSATRFGWSPDEDYNYPCFVYEKCGPGTYLYDLFKEPVLLISIPEPASPMEYYMEV